MLFLFIGCKSTFTQKALGELARTQGTLVSRSVAEITSNTTRQHQQQYSFSHGTFSPKGSQTLPTLWGDITRALNRHHLSSDSYTLLHAVLPTAPINREGQESGQAMLERACALSLSYIQQHEDLGVRVAICGHFPMTKGSCVEKVTINFQRQYIKLGC